MPQKPKIKETGPPVWMLTYSDLVTLLLTFFILLLSMSSMDETRFSQARESLEKAFTWRSKAPPESLIVPIPPITRQGGLMPVQPSLIGHYYKGIRKDLRLVGLDARVEAVQRDHGTLVLRIQESILFAPGSALLKPESYPILRKIADIIRPLPLFLRIEGHSDAEETKDLAVSDWDLSVARAVGVMSFYHKNDLLLQERMAATGQGATRPLAKDADSAGNRRVEFLLQAIPFPGTAESGDLKLPF